MEQDRADWQNRAHFFAVASQILRRVLVDHAQQPLAMFKYALHLKSVDWGKVIAVNSGSPEEMDAAFRRGEGDFIHLQGPLPQQLEKDGVGRIVGALGEVIPPIAFSSRWMRST